MKYLSNIYTKIIIGVFVFSLIAAGGVNYYSKKESDSRFFKVADAVLSYTAAEVDTKTAVTFTLRLDPSPVASPTDATTYYWGSLQSAGVSTTTAATRQFVIPFNCTLVGYSLATRSTAACTAETGTLYMRINNTTDVTLSSAVTFGVGGGNIVNYFSDSALSSNLTAGDKIEMKFTTPTWSTDATSIYMSTILFFKSR